MNVFENVAFGLKMLGLSRAEKELRVTSVLEKVNLTGFKHRRVTDLSGGEQQRVALARALAPNPHLLMFDEPLGALDRSLREQLLEELRDILRTSGVPAIYVTHDQDEAFKLADRILLLHDGEIVREGGRRISGLNQVRHGWRAFWTWGIFWWDRYALTEASRRRRGFLE